MNTPNKIKILVFGMTQMSGGVESFIMNYYRHINRDLVQFDFISFTDDMAYKDEVIALGGKIIVVTPRHKSATQNYKELKAFFKEHASEYYGVHLHLCSASNITCLNLAKKFCIPKRIVHSHNSAIMEGKGTKLLHSINVSKCLKNATDFFACSTLAGQWFFGEDIIKNPRFRVINNAIDAEKFEYDVIKRKEVRAQLGLNDNFVIGNVARFHDQKNHLFLIDVFNEVYKKDNKARLLLIGTGELQAQAEAKVNSLGLSDVTMFLGNRNDIKDLMQAMDVFLLPSKYEGLPIVLVEAQASGLPCVTSKDVVTKEADIVGLVDFVDLNEGAIGFSKKVLELKNHNREDTFQKIREAQYDISSCAKWLTDFYMGKTEDKF